VIDCYASEEHFADHLLPVYQALTNRGQFLIGEKLAQTTNRWGGDTKPEDSSRPVLVSSYGDQKRMRRAGRTRIARIEHGAGQSYGTEHGSYAGGKDADDVGLFLMPNEYSASLWRARYPGARVEVIGSPRLDSLPGKNPGPLTVAIGFHWDCHLVPETVSAFSTFRFALEELAANYHVIGHGHPRAWVGPPSLTKRYRRLGITDTERDFTEVCRRADLYICDNSSSMFEFAATGRPVVVMNSPHYRRDVHHGLRFWDAATVGVQVNKAGDLLMAVEVALMDPPARQKAREAALSIVYPYRSGAAQRAAEAIEDWI
jgi:hypothetical protein